MTSLQIVAAAIASAYHEFINGLPGLGRGTVTEPMSLTRYLDREGYPRWRQAILFRNNGVDVALKQSDGSYVFEKGHRASELRVGYPLPRIESFRRDEDRAQYQVDLNVAADISRDYVLVFKDITEDFFEPDEFIANLDLSHRNRGAFVWDRTREDRRLTLEDLTRTFGEDQNIDAPPKRIFICSHAYWQSILLIPTANNGLNQFVDYESVDMVLPQLRMSDLYLEPRKDTDRPPALIFTGCGSGRAMPLITKLRDAINPKLQVFAPKYWFGILHDTRDDRVFDYAEYMSQPFEIYAKRPLSRVEVVDQLRKRQDKSPLNQQVPAEEWENLVPLDAPTAWSVDDDFFLKRKEVGTFLWYEILEEQFRFGTTATREQFNSNKLTKFREAVAAVPAVPNPIHRFAPNHPFPMWKRFGFNSARQLLDKFSWSFDFIEGAPGQPNTIVATGSAYHYTMLVPIGDARGRAFANRRLVCNRYVTRQTDPLPPSADFPELRLNDERFWGSVPPR